MLGRMVRLETQSSGYFSHKDDPRSHPCQKVGTFFSAGSLWGTAGLQLGEAKEESEARAVPPSGSAAAPKAPALASRAEGPRQNPPSAPEAEVPCQKKDS